MLSTEAVHEAVWQRMLRIIGRSDRRCIAACGACLAHWRACYAGTKGATGSAITLQAPKSVNSPAAQRSLIAAHAQ